MHWRHRAAMLGVKAIALYALVRLAHFWQLLLRVILWTPKRRRTSVSCMAWHHMHKVYNKRVRNLAVSKEPWDNSEVIRDKHRINKNIPWLGPQKKHSSRATSAAEKVCLSRMTPNWRMRTWNTELAYCSATNLLCSSFFQLIFSLSLENSK